MSHRTVIAALLLALSSCATVPEEDAPPPPDPLVLQREAAFAELLTGSRLVGYTTLSTEPDAAPKQDSYTLTRVSKAEGDRFLFEAIIEFGGGKFPFALELPVLWAGDSPVIAVTDMTFPMVGTYTARVLFLGDQYVGVWTGKGYGGQMWGRVVRDSSEGAGQPSSSTSAPASD